MSSQEVTTFALVHGAWHDAWCMNRLGHELGKRGYPSIAMNMPIHEPYKDFEDYGLSVATALEETNNIVGVFHSYAGNYGPRAVNILNGSHAGSRLVRKMIFLASSFEASTLKALNVTSSDIAAAPARNTPESREAIKRRLDLGEDMTEFDAKEARGLLYPDVKRELAHEAISHLRPQRWLSSNSPLRDWPDVPYDYIICTHDRVVRPEWSDHLSREWLGVQPRYLYESGHSPHLARPAALANLLIKLSEQ